jgi:micrococcal nuclease
MSKKQSNIILGIIVLVVSAFALFFSGDFTKDVSFGDEVIAPDNDVYDKEVLAASIFPTNSPTPSIIDSISPIEPLPSESEVTSGYRVVKVVDGDTLDVDIDGKIERLRLIGIDTPETVDPRKEIQCFGIEASNKAKELLNGQYVTLEADDTQGERDKYKRLLRYVILSDGTNFNLYMISEGYAHEYTYDEAYAYQVQFRQAAEEARSSGKGLWSTDTCSGDK